MNGGRSEGLIPEDDDEPPPLVHAMMLAILMLSMLPQWSCHIRIDCRPSDEFVSPFWLDCIAKKLRVVVLFLNACVLLAIDTEGQNEE